MPRSPEQGDVRVQGCTFEAHTEQRLQAEPGCAPQPPLLSRVVAVLFAIPQLVEVRPTLPNMAPVLREVHGPYLMSEAQYANNR